MLIQYGANVDKGNNFGRTSLMKAAASGNLIAARMLVRAGADLLIRDSTQKTALDWARVAGHLSVVHFLEETIAIHIDKTRNRIDTDKLAKRLDELVAYNQRLLYIVEEGLRLKSPMEEILSVVRAATIDRDAFVSALIKLGREPRSELFYLDVEAKGTCSLAGMGIAPSTKSLTTSMKNELIAVLRFFYFGSPFQLHRFHTPHTCVRGR